MSQEQITLLQFLLLLALIVGAAKVAGHVTQRYLRLPVVFGEILAGVLLGPSLLNIFGWSLFAGEGNLFLRESLRLLAQLGVLLLMCIAGLETDLDQLRRVGNTAFWAAFAGVLLPLGCGALTGLLFHLTLAESLFIGAVLTATSVSISAQTLMEIGRLKSREGMVILGAAVIDDVLGLLVLSVVVAFAGVHDVGGTLKLSDILADKLASLTGLPATTLSVVAVFLLLALFFLLAVIFARAFTPLLRLAARLQASYAVPAVALILMLLYAVGAQFLGQFAAITGAYIAGLYLRQTPFTERILHALHPFTYVLFVPIFFLGIGLGTDVRALQSGGVFLVVLIVVAILTKIIGCGLGARWTGFTSKESLRVGIGMISRGEVGLIIAAVGLQNGLIHMQEHAALIVMVLVTTMVTPLLLRLVFPHRHDVATGVFESIVTVETPEEEERR